MNCTECNQPLTMHTAAGHRLIPIEGDISVCAYCGHISQFDSKLKLRKLDKNELDALFKQDPELMVQVLRVRLSLSFRLTKRHY